MPLPIRGVMIQAAILIAAGAWLALADGPAFAGSTVVALNTPPAVSPDGKRTDNLDGSANVSVWLNLPWSLSGKFGADFSMAPDPFAAADMTNGSVAAKHPEAAWAQLPLDSAAQQIGWDAASLEARAGFGGDESKIGGKISRLLAKRDGLALTLTQSASATRSVQTTDINQRPNLATALDANSELKLSLANTGTSFVVGANLTRDPTAPMATVGAEQQLFGDVKLSASVGRSDDGLVDSRIGASFKKTW